MSSMWMWAHSAPDSLFVLHPVHSPFGSSLTNWLIGLGLNPEANREASREASRELSTESSRELSKEASRKSSIEMSRDASREPSSDASREERR